MWRAGLLALALGACTQFPQLDETVEASAEAADYPKLIPLDPILADVDPDPEEDERTRAALRARAAALRARAAQLQGGVVDADTQARMRRGVPQG